MILKAKICVANKGMKSNPSYFAILDKSSNVQVREAVLLKYKEKLFPTVIRKYGESKHLYGFTVPSKIGKCIRNDNTIKFEFLSRNITNTSKITEINKINLIEILPKMTIINLHLYIFEIDRNNLLIWIFSKGNKPFILPKYIPLEKRDFSLLEVLGAFICEGFKARKKNKHLEKLSFSNAEREQIKWFIEALENVMNIDKKEWKLQILFPEKNSIVIEELKKYWSAIGIPENNIDIIKNDSISAKYGVCITNIYNSTLAEVFFSIMKYCKKISFDSRKYAIHIFRGFSRGDMGISKRCISFDSEKKEDVMFFKHICKQLDIETSNLKFNPYKKGWWTCYITGRNNFEKIIKFDGIRHTNRRIKLIKIILQNKQLSTYNYIKAVINNANTTKKSSKFIKCSPITSKHFLSKLEKEGYLKSTIKESHKSYSLTKRGFDTFNFYNDLENELMKNG